MVIKLHTPFAYVSRLNRIFSLKYAFIEYFERKTAAIEHQHFVALRVAGKADLAPVAAQEAHFGGEPSLPVE